MPIDRILIGANAWNNRSVMRNSDCASRKELQKPALNPPNWIFGPVWTTLYVLIGIAGARIFIRERGTWLPKTWFIQMALNFAWSPVFFSLHRPDLSLVILAFMLVAILAFIAMAWNRDRPSALLFLPYAAWVSFAGYLNAAIWWLNPL